MDGASQAAGKVHGLGSESGWFSGLHEPERPGSGAGKDSLMKLECDVKSAL